MSISVASPYRFRRPSGAWSPNDVSGLITWLRADLGITLSSGTSVSDWADQTVGGNNDLQQVTASARPDQILNVLNGHPVIRGDGVSHFMNNPNRAILNSGARTMFTVWRPVLSANTLLGDGTREVAGGGGRTGVYTATSSIGSFLCTPQWAARTPNQFHMLTWRSATGNNNDYTLKEDNGADIARVDAQCSNPDNHNPAWSIFCQLTNPTTVFAAVSPGDIAEIIAYDRALTSGEQDTIWAYISGRYAL